MADDPATPADAAALQTPWHALTPEQAAERLSANLDRGLDPEEAGKRLEVSGPNRLPEQKTRSRWRTFLDQFRGVLVVALVVAAAISIALGDMADGIAIVAILLLNAILGYLQERGAHDAISALRRMTAPSSRVRRGGQTAVVPSADLVPGDLVVLEEGDRIPADLRLASSSGLRTVEAALTGESEAVEKDALAAVPENADLPSRSGIAYQGTLVAAGTGQGIVVATGTATELGRIADLVRLAPDSEPPLQIRLRYFGQRLVMGAAAVVVLVFLLGLLRGVPLVEMLLSSVGLAVAAVPEGLPVIVTIALSLGVTRMAKRNALIRRLPAVETLGSATVICSDKTGTLTRGEMTAVAIATLADETAIEGSGPEPRGQAEGSVSGHTPRSEKTTDRTLHAAACASTARLVRKDDAVQVVGDPTEGALLVAAERAGTFAGDLDEQEPVVTIAPFDAARRRMSVVRRGSDGARAYVKGAPEVVLLLCTEVATDEGTRPLDDSGRAAILSRNATLAERGLRVLAIATKAGEDRPEEQLEFLGLVGLEDPLRAEAKEAVASCRSAGIRLVMITGDQAKTALVVARTLGIADADSEVLTGSELEAMDDEALAKRAPSVSVYARVSPGHKLRIVRAWKANGAVVAMTGDGVNDAPALKGADIGIAMGRTGTDVAKEAADMVIVDDNFASIVAAVEEGRAVFENVRKAVLYLLAGNVAEILVVTATLVAGLPLPLVPIQLLWINIVTDGPPALALATDLPSKQLLRRPPRPPDQSLADTTFRNTLVVTAVLASACVLAAYGYGLHVVGSVEAARSYAFATIVMEEVLRSLVTRSKTLTIWEIGLWSNRRLFAAVVAIIGLQVWTHRGGPLAGILHASRLDWGVLAALFALALVPATALELIKLVRRARARRPAATTERV